MFLRRAPRALRLLLTDNGRDMWPVLVTLRQRSHKWIAGEGREPVALLHTRCGTSTTAHLACDHCAERPERAELTSVAGPGLEDHWPLDHVGEVR